METTLPASRRSLTAVLAAAAAVAVLALPTQLCLAGGALKNHQKVQVKGIPNSHQFFSIEVPSHRASLTVALTAGQGDADLRIRHAQSGWEKQSATHGTCNEKIVVPNPMPGHWQIDVVGRTYFLKATLQAIHQPKQWGGGQPQNPQSWVNLGNGRPVHKQNGQGLKRKYRIHVPHHAAHLMVQTVGGSGSCALFVRHGGPATPQAHHRKSVGPGTHQKVTWTKPPPGDYYLVVQGRPSFQGISVVAEFIQKPPPPPGGPGSPGAPGGPQPPPPPNGPPPPHPGTPPTIAHLGPGHWVHHQNGRAQNRFYCIDVPPNARRLAFRTQGGQGNCALLVRRGGPPSPQHHERAQWGPGTHKTLVWHHPPAGVYYLLLHGQPQFQNVSVVAWFEMQ
jgi:hypothetical protein